MSESRPFDENTGLYDYRARWYDPAVGRFVNEDPSGFDGGDVNLYRYCNNSPVINVDPYGLCFSGVGTTNNSLYDGGYTTGIPDYVPDKSSSWDWINTFDGYGSNSWGGIGNAGDWSDSAINSLTASGVRIKQNTPSSVDALLASMGTAITNTASNFVQPYVDTATNLYNTVSTYDISHTVDQARIGLSNFNVSLDDYAFGSSNPYASGATALVNAVTRATPPLIAVIKKEGGEMRRFAIDCFQSLRDPRSVEPLLEILRDRNPWDTLSVNASVIALGWQRDKRAVPALQEILQNPKEDEWLRHFAAKSLGMIGDPSTFPVFVDILNDRKLPVAVRSGAVLGIGAYRTSAGELLPDAGHHVNILTLLGGVLNSKDEPLKLRMSVAQAMGNFGNQEAVDLLVPVADAHQHDALGFWAAVSVVKLTDGAIRDVGVVRAIKNYRGIIEGTGIDLQEQHDALRKIANHGTNLRVRLAARGLDCLFYTVWATIGVVAVSVAVAWLFRRKRRRSDTMNSQEIV